MPAVKPSFGTGGSNLSPNDSSGSPSLATVIRALVDDNTRANAITSADATDLATAMALVNEIKAALNAALTVTKG